MDAHKSEMFVEGAPSYLPPEPVFTAQFDRQERLRLERIALELLNEDSHLNRTDPFGNLVRAGLSIRPTLFFEDHRAIALYQNTGDSPLEYRMLCFAGSGDIVAIGGTPDQQFEAYCRDRLGLGRPQVLHLHGAGRATVRSIADRLIDNKKAMDAIAGAAKNSGGLSIVPYIADGHVWKLAGKISQLGKVQVEVAGPPPRLTHRVNNKLWFTDTVTKILGIESAPNTYSAFGLAALTRYVRGLELTNAKIIIKVPESAGSVGNVVVEAAQVINMSISELQHHLFSLLTSTGWQNQYPVLVSAWDQPVISSPSVQVWIPKIPDLPYSDGVFMQTTVGPERRFIGASRANLPAATLQELTQDALRIAQVFQKLGYFGRCSFDAVIVGSTYDDSRIHWIECNGRWGGVSVPLTLAHRLAPSESNLVPSFIQLTKLQMAKRSLNAVLELLEPLLFSRKGQSGVVILTPTRLTLGTGANLMALAPSKQESQFLLSKALSILLNSN